MTLSEMSATLDACLSNSCSCYNPFALLQLIESEESMASTGFGDPPHNVNASRHTVALISVETLSPSLSRYVNPKQIVDAQRRILAPQRFLENQKKSPLLALPAELRDMIWRLVVGDRVISFRERQSKIRNPTSWWKDHVPVWKDYVEITSMLQSNEPYFDRRREKDSPPGLPAEQYEPFVYLSSSKRVKTYRKVRKDPFWPKSLCLFSVSRQMRDELEEVFFSSNLFLFHSGSVFRRLAQIGGRGQRSPWTRGIVSHIKYLHVLEKDVSMLTDYFSPWMPPFRTLVWSAIDLYGHTPGKAYYYADTIIITPKLDDSTTSAWKHKWSLKVSHASCRTNAVSKKHGLELWLSEWVMERWREHVASEDKCRWNG